MEQKKKTAVLILILIAITAGIVIGVFCTKKKIEAEYRSALLYVGENTLFQYVLDHLQPIANYDYQDTRELIRFCQAGLDYEKGKTDKAREEFSTLDFQYLPEMTERGIEKFIERANQFTYREWIHDKYEKEWAEEQQRLLKTAQSGFPYVGMEESFIAETKLGAPSPEVRHNRECINGQQYWANLYDYIEDGRVVFTARCVNGVVIQIWDKHDKIDRVPSYRSSSSADEYDVSDFRYAEDFYEYYYDDFMDYYEAEDYFEEHKKN